MPIRPRDFFHIGILVDDIATSAGEFGEAFGYSFGPAFEGVFPMRRGDVEESPLLRMALTRQFPHLKLVETRPGIAGGLFAEARLLHYGFWVDDVQEESARLSRVGLPLVLQGTAAGAAGTPWAYHHLTDGMLLELISRDSRPQYRSMLEGRAPGAWS